MSYKNPNDNQTILTLDQNYSLSSEAIALSHSLSKVNFALSKLYDSERFDNILNSLMLRNCVNIDFNFLLYEFLNFDETSNQS